MNFNATFFFHKQMQENYTQNHLGALCIVETFLRICQRATPSAHVAGSRNHSEMAPFPAWLGLMKNWLQQALCVHWCVCVSVCICAFFSESNLKYIMENLLVSLGFKIIHLRL